MKITETRFNLSGPLTTVKDDCFASVDIMLEFSEHEIGGSPLVNIIVPVRYKQGSTIAQIRKRARAEAVAVIEAVHGFYAGKNPK